MYFLFCYVQCPKSSKWNKNLQLLFKKPTTTTTKKDKRKAMHNSTYNINILVWPCKVLQLSQTNFTWFLGNIFNPQTASVTLQSWIEMPGRHKNWGFNWKFSLKKKEILRASVCKYRKPGASCEIFNFFIFCLNKPFSELFSKMQLKVPKALYFFQNRGKSENRHFGFPPPSKKG